MGADIDIPVIWYWVWVIPVVLGGIFTWRYQADKCRLSNGLWFSAAFYSFWPHWRCPSWEPITEY